MVPAMKVPARLKKRLMISYGSLYLLGVAYWLSRLFFRKAGEFGPEPRSIEKVLGPLHLTAAFGSILVLGMLWDPHIRAAIRTSRHRLTGWLPLGVLSALALSGLCVLYGSEALVRFAEYWHPWIGASLGPLLLAHVFLKRVR